MTKLRILRWEITLHYLGELNRIMCLFKRRAGGSSQEGDLMMEAEVGVMGIQTEEGS